MYYVYRLKLLIKNVLAAPNNAHFFQKRRLYALEEDMFMLVVNNTYLQKHINNHIIQHDEFYCYFTFMIHEHVVY